MAFLLSFSKLTAHILSIDIKCLRRILQQGNDTQKMPELFSPKYIDRILSFGRNIESDPYSPYEDDFTLDPEGYAAEKLASMVEIESLTELVSLVKAILPRFPKLTDSMTAFYRLVAVFLYQKHTSQFQVLSVQESTKQHLSRGLEFFQAADDLLCISIDKHISGIGTENATAQIIALTNIYQMVLNGLCDTTSVEAFLAEAPEVPAFDVAEVRAYKWRFDMWVKLMKSSQMQMRVQAGSKMCDDLVNFWKRNNDSIVEDAKQGILSYFSSYLLRSDLIEYILGPTCHPEITAVTGNIIGFLAVTKTFGHEQCDLFWQTATSAQDPRVSDALLRMMHKIINFFDPDMWIYIGRKMESLPPEGFTLAMREFALGLFGRIKSYSSSFRSTCSLEYPPFVITYRLLRESSIPPMPNPDLYLWASEKFREQVQYEINITESRRAVTELCVDYITKEPRTSLGSLQAICGVLHPAHYTDLRHIRQAADLPRILVEELEHAISNAKGSSEPHVLHTITCRPRRELVANMISILAEYMAPDLAARMWTALVGEGSCCEEDRAAAWAVLNWATKMEGGDFQNKFLRSGCTDFLPRLDAKYFCPGALEFLSLWAVPRAKMHDTQAFENPKDPCYGGIEQIWRMILQCPPNTIETVATKTLVKDIYIDNPALVSFPAERTRKIHLEFVNRCLQQLKLAAQKLRAFSDGTSNEEDELMVIIATEEQISEQEVIFKRSLVALREFMEIYQTHPEFLSPDLRAMMPEAPDGIQGDPACLKYQSFDGDNQTDVLDLQVGKQNTAASLLASLKEVTGFDNYRLFYRGRALQPSEKDICCSLEELNIHNGLILVKKIPDPQSPSPTRVRAGVSSLEMEVLGHFQELWEYLSMGENIAQEVSNFCSIIEHIMILCFGNSISILILTLSWFVLGLPFFGTTSA